MDATLSTHVASIYAARAAGHRLRTSQCIRIPASPELVYPGYRVGDQLYTQIQVRVQGGDEIALDLRLSCRLSSRRWDRVDDPAPVSRTSNSW
jgi:hypothetical protein